jgi:NAD(P)-dependent dehydrogenase (short-subunit alcohol dehydrogenase family)
MMTAPKAIYPDLANKTVAITGGASGIGAAIVSAFHEQGAKVIFFDIDVAAGHELAKELGKNAYFYELDLTDLDQLTKVFSVASQEVGPINILVNNGANDMRHDLMAVTPDYWRQSLAVNLDHQFFAAKAVIPYMCEQQTGAIVNMSSIAWRLGLENAPAYVASKAAIEGLTHSLARELGPEGIRVNCILPGFVETPKQLEKWITPDIQEQILNSQCLKRFNKPPDIANIVLMLASDVSQAMTNQTIVADAGWI